MQKPSRIIEEANRRKKLIIFDLDGTLTETKSVVDQEMAELLGELLKYKQVAIIGGGRYELFKEQLVNQLKCPKTLFANLFLFPTTATSFYRYNHGWKKVYVHELSSQERAKIKKAFREAFREISYQHPSLVYGRVIEDRKTQVTFSALGQDVVKILGEEGVRLKKEWRDKNIKLKIKLAQAVQRRLPQLEVRAAGYTSIDVTRKGIDKRYGILQVKKYLKTPLQEMIFVGDAFFPGGNDSAVLRTGIFCLEVDGPRDTKKIIRFFLIQT